MAEDQPFSHRLTLTDRTHLRVTGVREVVGFDETGVILSLGEGTLIIQGHGLQLKALTPEDGQVIINGQIAGMNYGEETGSRSWFRRLLG